MKTYNYLDIDWNKDINRDSLNHDIYNAKLDLCKAYVDGKINNPYTIQSLFLDLTTFSYLQFRLNGERLSLYPYQDMILNDPHRFKIFRAANQIGKSLGLDVKAARNLLKDHGKAHNEAIVSKSLPQSTHQMRRVKSILETMPHINWKEVKGSSDSMSVISVNHYYAKDDKEYKKGTTNLKYTNLLICAPCTEGLLGYDLHELNLDEFEFWDVDIGYFFKQVAQPRTYHTKGRITIFSNPNGADTYVAELEKQYLKDGITRKWHVYVFDYLDCPGNTQEEYDELKHELPRAEFESTVAAIRTMSDRYYFTGDEIEKSLDMSLDELKMIGKQPFFFLDVGSKHDQSYLCGGFVEPDEKDDRFCHIYIPILKAYPVGYPISRVVGSEVNVDDGWHHEKSVKEYLDEWSKNGIVPTFGVDVTGNSGISPLFNAINIYPQDITFSGPVKSGMFQRFKYFMEKGLLHRVKSKEWDYQARHIIMKKSMRGYLMVHHENENDLDDSMDATAGLIFLADNPVAVTPTVRFF